MLSVKIDDLPGQDKINKLRSDVNKCKDQMRAAWELWESVDPWVSSDDADGVLACQSAHCELMRCKNDLARAKEELLQAQRDFRSICTHPIMQRQKIGAHMNMVCYQCTHVHWLCSCADCKLFRFACGE